MVVAQHGMVGTMMATPIDVSYLADTVILLRFFEARGAVRRAISVVKKRTGAHEPTIREFQIGPDGLRVGEALTEFQGVLTGVPHYIGGIRPAAERCQQTLSPSALRVPDLRADRPRCRADG